jgi:hypothetical protein
MAPAWIAISKTLTFRPEIEQAAGQDQVAGGGNRQEFGEALDQAHDDRFEGENEYP